MSSPSSNASAGSTPAPVTALARLSQAQLAYWLARQHGDEPLCVVAVDDEAATALAADLATVMRQSIALLLCDERSPFALAAADAREGFASAALRDKWAHPVRPQVVVASAAAAQSTWPPLQRAQAVARSFVAGDEVDREALAAHLLLCGYSRVNAVEDVGTFAVRGGVVDVFVPEDDAPVRLDLFGDELASIHAYSADAGAFKVIRGHVRIAPIREVVFDADAIERAVAWLDHAREHVDVPSRVVRERQRAIEAHQYFFGIEAMWPAFYGEENVERVLKTLLSDGRLLVLVEPERIDALWQKRFDHSGPAREQSLSSQGPQVATESLVTAPEALRKVVQATARVEMGGLFGKAAAAVRLGDFAALREQLGERRRKDEHSGTLAPMVRLLRDRHERGESTFVCASHHGAALRLRELLLARGLDVPVAGTLPSVATLAAAPLAEPALLIAIAPLSSSVDDPTHKVALLSDADVFGASKPARQAAKQVRAKEDALNALHDLRPGDCVIHQDHGIGRYQGLVRLTLDGVDGDFVLLHYADDDKLYVPVFRLSVLHRYHGVQSNARLDKLGSGRFEKAKRRVRDAVLAMAHAMLALEAKRRSITGFALPAPDEQYAQFEARFAYEETPDQARAIADTLADLQQAVPMDRLICGDVGFGKTEVALRAAFLAVQGGKQVAVLVPTTVLAEQHRETFAARLGPFAMKVASLSRFTTAKDRRNTVLGIADKTVDVVIGTHRLLSQDVQFADLGLLVVDEEQRFGVTHKERIKRMRTHVHVLTLSATPIPRTLHMATSGMRQLSIISTPPTSRTSIRTEVMRQDETAIAEAIGREMTRGGQTFVVYNRVQGIEDVRAMISRLVPGADVLVGHGQMHGHELEAIMERFVHRRAHVLVCTAIIESGIDIPSVNTMIVLDAHAYGLSQLYQLRGRIGRGEQRAYAYLMLPPHLPVNKEVAERLNLLKRFSTLGSGFQVATHDLEMRGAGDLLGSDQSGHIAAVGFELYTQLLHEAVEVARGRGARAEIEPDIKLPVAAVFPERYMREPIDRLTYYQRMSEAADVEQIYEIVGEVASLFGPPPPEAEALAELMVLRRRLQVLGICALSGAMDGHHLKLGITFAPDGAVDRQKVFELCQAHSDTYRALPSGRLAVKLPLPPLQPADEDRGQKVPYVLGTDLLRGVGEGLAALTTLPREPEASP